MPAALLYLTSEHEPWLTGRPGLILAETGTYLAVRHRLKVTNTKIGPSQVSCSEFHMSLPYGTRMGEISTDVATIQCETCSIVKYDRKVSLVHH